MKKYFILFAVLIGFLASSSAWALSPFWFSTVAYDANGAVVTSGTATVVVTITGTFTNSPYTQIVENVPVDAYGVFSVQIGGGTNWTDVTEAATTKITITYDGVNVYGNVLANTYRENFTSKGSILITDSNVDPAAEIQVSKLADGDARQLLQTAANGIDVEWTNDIAVPGTISGASSLTLGSQTQGGSIDIYDGTNAEPAITMNSSGIISAAGYTISGTAGTIAVEGITFNGTSISGATSFELSGDAITSVVQSGDFENVLGTVTDAQLISAAAVKEAITGASNTLAGSKFLTYAADDNLSAEIVPTGGAGITYTYDDAEGTATWDVNVDGSTIEINTDALRVKASGITANELAADAVTTAKILNSNVTVAKIANGTANQVMLTNGAGDATSWGLLTNANIDAAAEIAYSKLDLAGSIVDADVATGADIDVSKLYKGTTEGYLLVAATGTNKGGVWTDPADLTIGTAAKVANKLTIGGGLSTYNGTYDGSEAVTVAVDPDATLAIDGTSHKLGINLDNENTWTGAQTFNVSIDSKGYITNSTGSTAVIVRDLEGLVVNNGTTNIMIVDGSGNTTIAGTLGVTGATTLSSTLAVTGSATIGNGVTSTSASSLSFYGPGNGTDAGTTWTAFKAQTQGSNITYTLPAALPGTGNYYLKADTDGGLTWATASAANVANALTFGDGLSPNGETFNGSSAKTISVLYDASLKVDGTTKQLGIDLTHANHWTTNTQWFDLVDIDGGSIDGTAIGANSASTGAFTTLSASSATTLSSTLAVTGDVTVNTNKFTVTASSGNTNVGGTLGVTGNTTLGGTLKMGVTAAANTTELGAAVTTFIKYSGAGNIASTVLPTVTEGTIIQLMNTSDTSALTITGLLGERSTVILQIGDMRSFMYANGGWTLLN